jgi:hypothetical protein
MRSATVLGTPGVGMVAPPEVPRNAEGAQSEGRAKEDRRSNAAFVGRGGTRRGEKAPPNLNATLRGARARRICHRHIPHDI